MKKFEDAGGVETDGAPTRPAKALASGTIVPVEALRADLLAAVRDALLGLLVGALSVAAMALLVAP